MMLNTSKITCSIYVLYWTVNAHQSADPLTYPGSYIMIQLGLVGWVSLGLELMLMLVLVSVSV